MASNAMLAVPAKRSGYLDIKSPIENYIARQFSSGAAKQAASALQRAQLLRNDAAELKGGADDVREAFQGYYRFLTALEGTLPVGKERGGANLRFQWADAFQPDRGDGRSDVAFEKAALLFNMGAIASQVAMGADLSSENGVKSAARAYQEAAGVFRYLRDRLVPRLESPQPVDLSPDATGLLAMMCLAQAQECFYTKAAADRKSPALLARIAQQVAEMYRDIASLQLPDQLRRELGKPMAAHLSIKAGLYAATTLLHQAAVFIADDECGQQIACLQEAQRLLQEGRREGTGWVKVDRELIQKVDDALGGIDGALAKAERENSSLYFQRVPKAEDLAPPAPALLVAPVPPPEDLEAVDDKWFGYLASAGATPQDDRNRSARAAFMGQADTMPQRTPSPTPQPTSEASGGGGIGGGLGRFAFGAAKGVAGWALNQAVDAVSDANAGARRDAARKDAASRNIAAMYDSPRSVSVGDVFGPSPTPTNGRSTVDSQRGDSARYVEAVRDVINTSIDRIASADRERDAVLDRLRLPQALGAAEGASGGAGALPRDVQKAIDGHRRAGGVQHLVQLLDQISEMRATAVQSLERVETGLDKEAQEDEAARQHYGDGQWPLQPTSVVAANLRDRLAGYRQNLREADESDAKLAALVNDNATQFAALGLGRLPGRQQQDRRGGDDVLRATAELRSDLSRADGLAEERRRLHDAFKRQWNEDDIIQGKGRHAQWELDQGFRKFEDLQAALQRNADAQQQVLDRLQADMKQFGDVLSRQSSSAQEQARDAAKTVKKFGNVEESLRGGIQFYADLQGYIATLERETNEYLEQRYAEGKDAVGLLERTRSGWEGVSGGSSRSSGSRESRGGLWPFGGGKKSDTRWFAEPQRLQRRSQRLLPQAPQPTRRMHLPRSSPRPRPRCAAAALARQQPATVPRLLV